jgi:hypothetical protein
LPAGIYKLTTYQRISPEDPLISPYITIPLCWAIYNFVAPYLFVHYCFSQGASLRRACRALRLLGNACFITAVVLVWFSMPLEFNVETALAKGLAFLSRQRADGFTVGGVADWSSLRVALLSAVEALLLARSG